MKVSQSPDMIVSCLPFSLCLPVLSSIAALRTLVVPIVQLLQTSKLLKKKNKRNFRRCKVGANQNPGSPQMPGYS
jgi:hypothetical protein